MFSVLMIPNTHAIFAQVNSSNTNQSGISDNSNQPIIKSIDAGITAIKNGNNDEAKKLFYQAESALEGKPGQVNTEKHIEASLKSLKDGDSNAAITHAEEAKKNLS